MGFFSRKKSDGLPADITQLHEIARWTEDKIQGKEEYYYRACLKAVDLLRKEYERGSMTGGNDGRYDPFMYCAARLRQCYEEGRGCPIDLQAAFSVLATQTNVYVELADRGTLTATQRETGLWALEKQADYYVSGRGCEKSLERALQRFRIAYDVCSFPELDHYGTHRVSLLLKLIGGWPWPVQLREVKKRALEMMMGGDRNLFESGAEVMRDAELLEDMDWQALGQDEETDFHVFQQWAERGNAYALYCLGRCYWDGKGTEQDQRKGFECLEKASDFLVSAALEAESCTYGPVPQYPDREEKDKVGEHMREMSVRLQKGLKELYTRSYLEKAAREV